MAFLDPKIRFPFNSVIYLFLLLNLFSSLTSPALAYKFEDKEFFGMAKSVHDIRLMHKPEEYVFVGIGRSPAPLIAYQQEYGDDAYTLPMTWSSSKYEDDIKKIRKSLNKENDEDFALELSQLEAMDIFSARDKMKLKDHFNRFLGPAIEQAIRTRKKLMLMDFVSTGMGMLLTNLYMNDYLKKTGLLGKLEVEYLAIGLEGNNGLTFNSPKWHSYTLDPKYGGNFHGSLVLKSIKDYAEFGNFVVDGDTTKSSALLPNLKYKELKSAIKERHPRFLKQINYTNGRYQIHHLSSFKKMIKAKIKDGTCDPKKTMAVFDIDSVLTVDELDENYPMTQEMNTASEVLEIQALGITTMALTNRKAISDYNIPTKFQRTSRDLRDLGINFKKSSSLIEGGLKAQGLWFTHSLDKNGAHADGPQSVFYNGIYSIGHDPAGKGVKLENLLKRAKLDDSIECLFFVDDSLDNNKSVEEQFKYKKHVFSANLQTKAIPIFEILDISDSILEGPNIPLVGSASCIVEEVD